MNLDQGRADELAALLAIAREGSFVAAAAALQRHSTGISKRISMLEQRLGVRLLERTTRRVRLTEAGARLAERLQMATDAIFEAEQEAAAGGAELRGRLRLAFPAAMGRQWLAQALPEFARQYPRLQLDVDYAERYVDLVGEGFDVALRLGTLGDSRLVARRLGDHRIVLGASQDYLDRHGVPASPGALASHNLLRYTGPGVDARMADAKGQSARDNPARRNLPVKRHKRPPRSGAPGDRYRWFRRLVDDP